MALVGYARVSSIGQSLDVQLDKLQHCHKIFQEKASGASGKRPRPHAGLEYVREGDTLVVDTTGFEPTRGITVIPGGGFRTASSHLVERYRLLKNGTVLSVRFTWTDPSVFQTPHSYEFRYQRVERGYEPWPYQLCDPFDQERAAFLDQPR